MYNELYIEKSKQAMLAIAYTAKSMVLSEQNSHTYIDGSRAVYRVSPNCSFPPDKKVRLIDEVMLFYLQDF